MNKFLLVIFLFLSSCTSNAIKNDFHFSDEMNFEEFKIKLEKYANQNSYPNIDK